jgi:hypothetical protein
MGIYTAFLPHNVTHEKARRTLTVGGLCAMLSALGRLTVLVGASGCVKPRGF